MSDWFPEFQKLKRFLSLPLFQKLPRTVRHCTAHKSQWPCPESGLGFRTEKESSFHEGKVLSFDSSEQATLPLKGIFHIPPPTSDPGPMTTGQCSESTPRTYMLRFRAVKPGQRVGDKRYQERGVQTRGSEERTVPPVWRAHLEKFLRHTTRLTQNQSVDHFQTIRNLQYLIRKKGRGLSRAWYHEKKQYLPLKGPLSIQSLRREQESEVALETETRNRKCPVRCTSAGNCNILPCPGWVFPPSSVKSQKKRQGPTEFSFAKKSNKIKGSFLKLRFRLFQWILPNACGSWT